jgi:hypothetical protein
MEFVAYGGDMLELSRHLSTCRLRCALVRPLYLLMGQDSRYIIGSARLLSISPYSVQTQRLIFPHDLEVANGVGDSLRFMTESQVLHVRPFEVTRPLKRGCGNAAPSNSICLSPSSGCRILSSVAGRRRSVNEQYRRGGWVPLAS